MSRGTLTFYDIVEAYKKYYEKYGNPKQKIWSVS